MNANELLESRPCPVCGGDGGEPIACFPAGTYDHARFETASWDGRQALAMQIVRCSCGLVRTEPAFREDKLGYVYPDDLVEADVAKKGEERVFDGKNAKFLALARRVHAALGDGATLFDIGSRYGVFPWIAREQFGLDAWGLELNAAAVATGRRRFAHLLHGSIADLPALLEEHGVARVDGFVLDDVLEHLPHVGRDLATLASVQGSGGRLFLRQMDHEGIGRKIFGKRWYYYQPAAHMFYFDEASVRALLDRHGYDVEAVQRASVPTNLARTAARLPKAFWKRTRARPTVSGAKPSYLTQRFRGHDDMFLVTARKR